MRNTLVKIESPKIYIIIISILFTFCSSPVETGSLNSLELDLEKQLESISIEELSPEEIEGLVFMREEEKLARDVYIILYKKWNLRVFDNISKSEQKHTDAIKLLLDRYDLDDPVNNDKVGIFQNLDLQKLYNELITIGNDSISAALKVGASIEEIDILDLEKQINEVVNNEDILLVYKNLLRGSKNHLRAFINSFNNVGEVYYPEYLSETAYEEILNAENENSSNRNSGKRRRKGGK